MPEFFLVGSEETPFIRPATPEMPRMSNHASKSAFSVLSPGLEPALHLKKAGTILYSESCAFHL